MPCASVYALLALLATAFAAVGELYSALARVTTLPYYTTMVSAPERLIFLSSSEDNTVVEICGENSRSSSSVGFLDAVAAYSNIQVVGNGLRRIKFSSDAGCFIYEVFTGDELPALFSVQQCVSVISGSAQACAAAGYVPVDASAVYHLGRTPDTSGRSAPNSRRVHPWTEFSGAFAALHHHFEITTSLRALGAAHDLYEALHSADGLEGGVGVTVFPTLTLTMPEFSSTVAEAARALAAAVVDMGIYSGDWEGEEEALRGMADLSHDFSLAFDDGVSHRSVRRAALRALLSTLYHLQTSPSVAEQKLAEYLSSIIDFLPSTSVGDVEAVLLQLNTAIQPALPLFARPDGTVSSSPFANITSLVGEGSSGAVAALALAAASTDTVTCRMTSNYALKTLYNEYLTFSFRGLGDPLGVGRKNFTTAFSAGASFSRVSPLIAEMLAPLRPDTERYIGEFRGDVAAGLRFSAFLDAIWVVDHETIAVDPSYSLEDAFTFTTGQWNELMVSTRGHRAAIQRCLGGTCPEVPLSYLSGSIAALGPGVDMSLKPVPLPPPPAAEFMTPDLIPADCSYTYSYCQAPEHVKSAASAYYSGIAGAFGPALSTKQRTPPRGYSVTSSSVIPIRSTRAHCDGDPNGVLDGTTPTFQVCSGTGEVPTAAGCPDSHLVLSESPFVSLREVSLQGSYPRTVSIPRCSSSRAVGYTASGTKCPLPSRNFPFLDFSRDCNIGYDAHGLVLPAATIGSDLTRVAKTGVGTISVQFRGVLTAMRGPMINKIKLGLFGVRFRYHVFLTVTTSKPAVMVCVADTSQFSRSVCKNLGMSIATYDRDIPVDFSLVQDSFSLLITINGNEVFFDDWRQGECAHDATGPFPGDTSCTGDLPTAAEPALLVGGSKPDQTALSHLVLSSLHIGVSPTTVTSSEFAASGHTVGACSECLAAFATEAGLAREYSFQGVRLPGFAGHAVVGDVRSLVVPLTQGKAAIHGQDEVFDVAQPLENLPPSLGAIGRLHCQAWLVGTDNNGSAVNKIVSYPITLEDEVGTYRAAAMVFCVGPGGIRPLYGPIFDEAMVSAGKVGDVAEVVEVQGVRLGAQGNYPAVRTFPPTGFGALVSLDVVSFVFDVSAVAPPVFEVMGMTQAEAAGNMNNLYYPSEDSTGGDLVSAEASDLDAIGPAYGRYTAFFSWRAIALDGSAGTSSHPLSAPRYSTLPQKSSDLVHVRLLCGVVSEADADTLLHSKFDERQSHPTVAFVSSFLDPEEDPSTWSASAYYTEGELSDAVLTSVATALFGDDPLSNPQPRASSYLCYSAIFSRSAHYDVGERRYCAFFLLDGTSADPAAVHDREMAELRMAVGIFSGTVALIGLIVMSVVYMPVLATKFKRCPPAMTTLAPLRRQLVDVRRFKGVPRFFIHPLPRHERAAMKASGVVVRGAKSSGSIAMAVGAAQQAWSRALFGVERFSHQPPPYVLRAESTTEKRLPPAMQTAMEDVAKCLADAGALYDQNR